MCCRESSGGRRRSGKEAEREERRRIEKKGGGKGRKEAEREERRRRREGSEGPVRVTTGRNPYPVCNATTMASGKRKTRRRQQQHHEQRRQLAMTSPPSRSRFGSPASSPGFIRPGAGGVLSHFIQECYGGRTAPGDEGKRFHGQSEEDEEPVHDEDQAPGTNQQLTPFSE